MLEDDTGEDDCSEKLPSVSVCDTVSALESIKSYILAQEDFSILYCVHGFETLCSSCERIGIKLRKNN
jgi:hypothetical protein